METPKTDTSQELPLVIDAAWRSLLPFLRSYPNVYVGNPEDCKRFLSAVLWITREGASWRALPEVYGYWNTIYRRFGRWCDTGVFEALHEHFHDAGEISAISLILRWFGPTLVQRVPRKKRWSRRSVPRSKPGGFTTKLNLSLSDAWVPLRLILTPGNRNDITQAPALIEGYRYEYVIGDKVPTTRMPLERRSSPGVE